MKFHNAERIRRTVTRGCHRLISTVSEAKKEAANCLQCTTAPCSKACPAGTQPDKFIRSLYFDNLEGGAATILDNNPLGGVCGKVCPVSKLCEGACTKTKLDGKPVKIGALQHFLHEYGKKSGIPNPSKLKPNGKTVAIVGSGPAGIACARELARSGYQVTIFEARQEPGGALRYFLSPVRIDHDLVNEEIDRVVEMGVEIKTNMKIQSLEELNDFDHCFISPGLQAGINAAPKKPLGSAVCTALEFLESANTQQQYAKSIVKDKHVMVIGGGSVAMDVAVTSKKLGAKNVTVVAREGLDTLPADVDEVELATKEYGALILPNRDVESEHFHTLSSEEGGDFIKIKIENELGTDFVYADTIIMAIGQTMDETTKKIVEENNGFYQLGGDVLNGGATVVEAIKEGKVAAERISGYSTEQLKQETSLFNTVSLKTEFCGIEFPNPFCLSSSPVSNTGEMCARAFDAGWGGVYYKTLNLEDKFKIYHPSPRLNAVSGIGIQNVEQISDRTLMENLKDIAWLKNKYPKNIVGVSIMGFESGDWATLAKAAQDHGADILELNFSCPQMARKDAGHHVGQSFGLIEEYTRAAKEACSIPVIAKMTPNITDMVPAALAAQRGGADGISAINTVKSISGIEFTYENDPKYYPQPNIMGHSTISGFSGQGCRPMALRFVAEMGKSEQLTIPISGMGGMYTWHDAVEFMSLGASNLQCTTSVMNHGYRVVEDMIDGLERHLKKVGAKNPNEIVGKALHTLKEPEELDLKTEAVSSIDPNKCIACGLCVSSCADAAAHAIEFVHDSEQNSYAKVDQQKCVGCLMCKHVCPVEGAVHIDIRDRIQH